MGEHVVDELSLNAYLDGELDAQASEDIERILEQDDELRERLRSLREVDALLTGALKPALTAPSAIPIAQPVKLRGAKPWSYWPALAASLVALVVGALIGQQTFRPELASEVVFQRTFEDVMESKRSGTEVAWSNPDRGERGSLMPVRTWQTKSGQYCREYKAQRVSAKLAETETGVACRSDDGNWRVRMRYYD